jgi:tetratricopeptide (TPR) repeat protein
VRSDASRRDSARAGTPDDRRQLRGALAVPLRALRASSGDPPYTALQRLDPTLKRSTVSDVLRGQSMPSWWFVRAFVRACVRHAAVAEHDLDPALADLQVWRSRWIAARNALHDPTARVPPAAAPAEAEGRPAMTPRQLPAVTRDFVGRAADLARLSELAADRATGSSTVVVTGMPGVGKTSVALRWAHEVADEFPDGVLFAELAGFGPGAPLRPVDVLSAFLPALGVPRASLPAGEAELAALFRSASAGRRLLVVLDNAGSSDQVRSLLPASAGCVTVVTSRNRLTDLVIGAGAGVLQVQPMPDGDAIELLGRFVPPSDDTDRLLELAHLCGHLPLALRLAAEQIRANGGTEPLLTGLRDARSRLDALEHGLGVESAAVRTVLASAVAVLPSTLQETLAAIAALPGRRFTAESATAATGSPPGAVLADLRALQAANLIEASGSADGTFAVHDLIRAFLHDRVPAAARSRAASWYVHSAVAAGAAILPQRGPVPVPVVADGVVPRSFADADDALSWCDRELPNLVATVDEALRSGDLATAWQLPNALLSYFDRRKPWPAWIACFTTALRAAEALDRPAPIATASNGLGIAFRELRRAELAATQFERAAAAYAEAGEQVGAAMALSNLGNLYVDLRRYEDAVTTLLRAETHARAGGDEWRVSIVLNNLAEAEQHTDRVHEAIEHARRAAELCRAHDDPTGEAAALTSLGRALLTLGELDGAAAHLRRAIDLQAEHHDDYNRARTTLHLARVLDRRDERDAALELARTAVGIFDRLGAPEVVAARALLAALAG